MTEDPTKTDDCPREEYNFSGGVRGKNAERFAKKSNVVVVEPDLAAEFPTARAVNRAQREFLNFERKNAGERRVK